MITDGNEVDHECGAADRNGHCKGRSKHLANPQTTAQAGIQ